MCVDSDHLPSLTLRVPNPEGVGNPQPYGWRLDSAANAIDPMQAATRERAGKLRACTQTRKGGVFTGNAD
jgi:hypothetical protein